jgi:hypothetical protein
MTNAKFKKIEIDLPSLFFIGKNSDRIDSKYWDDEFSK